METNSSRVDPKRDSNDAMANAFSSIPVTVQVMIGTAMMQLSDLMNLKPGSDLHLDQAIGEPVIVIVNGTKIAKGELYVLESRDDLLGVRITEILSNSAV